MNRQIIILCQRSTFEEKRAERLGCVHTERVSVSFYRDYIFYRKCGKPANGKYKISEMNRELVLLYHESS